MICTKCYEPVDKCTCGRDSLLGCLFVIVYTAILGYPCTDGHCPSKMDFDVTYWKALS